MYEIPSYIKASEGFYLNLLDKIYTEIARAKTEQEYMNTIESLCLNNRSELMNENVLQFFINEEYETEKIVSDIKQYYISHLQPYQNAIISLGLEQNKKYTIVTMGEFGSISCQKITFDRVVPATYAQFDDAVKMTFKPFKKRSLYQSYFYNNKEILIYKGWKDFDNDSLYAITETKDCTTRTSKHTCFDRSMFDDVLEQLGEPMAKIA